MNSLRKDAVCFWEESSVIAERGSFSPSLWDSFGESIPDGDTTSCYLKGGNVSHSVGCHFVLLSVLCLTGAFQFHEAPFVNCQP